MRFLTASLFILSVAAVNAQLPADIKFTNYNRTNGLPEEQVNNITQDSRGFLWMGTREGLIRFDGLYYKTWYADPNDPSKFSNNNIRVVPGAGNGKVMFLSGAELWEVNVFNHLMQKVPSFRDKKIFAIPKKINGDRWLLIDINSVYLTDNGFNILYTKSIQGLFPANTLASIFPLHTPWFLFTAGSLNRVCLFNYQTKNIIPFYLDDSGIDSRAKFFEMQAYDSSRGRLYMSSYFNGLFYCDLNIPGVTRYKPVPMASQKDGSIRKIILLPDGRMLQAGERGLYITDSANIELYNKDRSADNPPVSSVMLDIYPAHDGDYWLSTVHGVSRFNLTPPDIHYIRTSSQKESESDIKSIVKGSDGNIYFLTGEKNLFRIERKNNRCIPVDNTGIYGWSATRNGDEIIAAGGTRKLTVYNTAAGKLTHPGFLQPFFTNNTDLITLVFRAGNGDLWYSCNGGAGIIHNPAGTAEYIQYTRTSVPPAFSHSYVHCAAEDSHGDIWWASNRNSMLLQWDAGLRSFKEHNINMLIPQFKGNTGINNLFADRNDNLWIALDGAALVKFDVNKKSGSYYDINSGLPSDAVSGITADSKNRVWFGTRKGLCCYLPETGKFVIFTHYDGLPGDNFTSNGILYDKEEDLLYAAAGNTIVFFHPDTLLHKTVSAQPQVYIDEMKVNGKSRYFTQEQVIALNPSENNIEFDFACPDFYRNNQLEFQYLLKSPASDWVDIGDNRRVTFNNLSSGKYTISVRCKYKGNEKWTETTVPLSFIIKTPWFKTAWFRLLLIFLIACIVWFIIRNYYLRKLERQKAAAERIQAIEKERTRIATDMHDDFGASLSRIKFISEKMQLTQKEDDPLKKDLTKISEYSDEMAEKMNEIVWALNQRYDSCADLVSFCRAYASEFMQDKTIRFSFSSGEIPDKKIQGEVRRNIFLVMKEALHNIVRHSGATEAAVNFAIGTGIDLVISDNGRGFNKNNIRPFANGLENMKKRMSDISGNADINGENGTIIRITVPI